MNKLERHDIGQSMAFMIGLHACTRSSVAEHAVLTDLGAAFLADYPAAPAPLPFAELRRRHCEKIAPDGQKVGLWRALKGLRTFLKFSHPPIPPTGVKWNLVTTTGRARSAWLKPEFEKLPSPAARPTSRQNGVTRGREGIRPRWNKKLLNDEFNAAERPIKYPGQMVENVRVVARRIPGKALTLRFEGSPGKSWKFSRHMERQKEFEKARDVFWADAVEAHKQSAPRLWNGRLWCLAGYRKVGVNNYDLDLRRTRYADSLYVSSNWKSELPPALAVGAKSQRETFADHCKHKFSNLRAYQSAPPVSLVRVGVIVWLSKSSNFLCTTFGSSKKIGLAGQGTSFTIYTPEEKATPKIEQQIPRRLVEDIGLAIERHNYKELAFVQDAGVDGTLERPWVFAVVETDKSYEQMNEIFEARRYPQFAETIVSIPAVELVRACSERDFDKYERSLLIAAVLFFASKGAAEISA